MDAKNKPNIFVFKLFFVSLHQITKSITFKNLYHYVEEIKRLFSPDE